MTQRVRAKLCQRGRHRDKWLRGKRRIKCENCGDIFPCYHDCGHLDGAEARLNPEGIQLEWAAKND